MRKGALVKRLRGEEGMAMVMALMIMVVLMGLGAALLLTANSQQHQAGNQQSSESAYALAEAALNAQVFQLSLEWPTSGDGPSTTSTNNYGYPNSCNAASNGMPSFVPTAPPAMSTQ